MDEEYLDDSYIFILDKLRKYEQKELQNNTNLCKQKLVNDFKDYYITRNKRHNYSDIEKYYNKIILRDEEDEEYFTWNLDIIINYCTYTHNDQVFRELLKLKDHIELTKRDNLARQEIKRYFEETLVSLVTRSKKQQKKMINEVEEQQSLMINDVEEQQSLMINEVEEQMHNKLENLNTEFITVLSIFSAVILSVFGSFKFIGDVTSKLGPADKEYIVFVASILGMVTFNLMYSLFYIIGKTIGKPITFCDSYNCSECKSKKDCYPINFLRLVKKHTPFFLVNIVLLFVILRYTI